MPLLVFLVAWLFTDEHNLRSPAPFSEHGLGGMAVEVTAAAVLRRRREDP
jgi:hypothetical protein